MKTHYKIRCEPFLGLKKLYGTLKMGMLCYDWLHILAALEARTGQLISRGVGMSFVACVMCCVYSRTEKVENLNVRLYG